MRRASSVLCMLVGLAFVGVLCGCTSDSQSQSTSQDQARQLHEQHLAWQKAHPKEYAAQLTQKRAETAREAAEAARGAAQQREQERISNLPENKAPCEYANSRINQGWSDWNASEYRAAYDVAVKGLTVNDRCSDDDFHVVNEGFLLSVKGMAEHYLSAGDSRTDLHQAETQLEECQTRPNLYGTHTGASCQTQQENDINTETGWEMND